MLPETDVAAEAEAAYARWLAAVDAHDEAGLRRIHHEDFVYTGVDGRRMNADEHIAMELTAEVEEHVSDVIAFDLGDVVVSAGRHTVQGEIDHELLPESIRGRIAGEGLLVAFTTVWVREQDELRAVTHHLQIVGAQPEGAR